MGFKSRARANDPKADDDRKKKGDKEGKDPCGVNGCEGWADSTMGGRSLSVSDAEDMWGKSVVVRKSRVRVCKSCYRSWKKTNKQDEYY